MAARGLVVALLCGCGGRGAVPIEGTITLDGKPLSGATVGMELIDGPKDSRLFSGETDPTGRYTMRPFEKSWSGAPPGEYRVMITSVKAPPGANEMTVVPKDPVPAEYQNGSKTITVPPEGLTNADFAIKTR